MVLAIKIIGSRASFKNSSYIIATSPLKSAIQVVGDETQIPCCRGPSAELGRDSPKTPPEGV